MCTWNEICTMAELKAAIRAILQLNGAFCWELVHYNTALFVLHTTSIISFHLLRACSKVVFEFE